MKELIYSRQFPSDDDRSGTAPDVLLDIYNGFSERSDRKLVYIPIPGRAEIERIFYFKAIEIANRYKYDIRAYSTRGGTEVYLSFDQQLNYTDLPYLIGMADNISVHHNILGREFTFCLTLYTHEIYRDGKRVLPEPEKVEERPES